MSGIVFLSTVMLDDIVEFYTQNMGASIWLEQDGCTILKHGNMLLGFCRGEKADVDGTITLFYPTREDVDRVYRVLEETATGPPAQNPRFSIYNFFAQDPEGRRLEAQSFLHPLGPYICGEELIATRRSVRRFTGVGVEDSVLEQLFELCAHAPSSRNRQPWNIVVVRDPAKLEFLGSIRGESSAPISRAPLAIAVCIDTKTTSRPQEDGSIMSYHLLLSAWLLGLGTCWIAAMDRDDVKDCLDIPEEQHIACITPIGWPAEKPPRPGRKKIECRRI